MISNYGKGHKISRHVNVVPPEAMTGDNIHDLAVCCAIWTAGKWMSREELAIVADAIRAKHPNYPSQVAKTCKQIAQQELGYIYFV